MTVWFDGRLVSDRAVPFSAFQRLRVGDGLFETIRHTRDDLPLGGFHQDRLRRAADALRIDLPDTLRTAAGLRDAVADLVWRNAIEGDALVRLVLARRGGGGWHVDDRTCSVLIEVEPSPFGVGDDLTSLAIWDGERLPSGRPVHWKGPEGGIYGRAQRWGRAHGDDEVVLLAADGHLAETHRSALLVPRDDRLLTPDPERTGAVASVTVAALRATGQPIEPTDLRPEDVAPDRPVLVANALRGVRPVVRAGLASDAADRLRAEARRLNEVLRLSFSSS